MSSCGLIHNGLMLFLLGLRIEACNRILLYFFRYRKFMRFCPDLDKHLENLRKEFLLLEARHNAIVGCDDLITPQL